MQSSIDFHHIRLSPLEQIGVHEHPEWEISWIISGHGVRMIGNRQETFQEGEVLMIPPDLPHCWQFDTSDDVIENTTLLFSPIWLEQLPSLFPEFKESVVKIQSQHEAVRFSGETLQKLQNINRQMIGMDAVSRLLSSLEMLTIIAGTDDKRVVGFAKFSEAEERLHRIENYISCNYNRDINIDLIARHIGMNRSSLCSFFKRQTGKTIIEAINERRLNAASNLLRKHTLSITQICYDCGFKDTSYFFRLFKSEFGMTPKKYRSDANNIETENAED